MATSKKVAEAEAVSPDQNYAKNPANSQILATVDALQDMAAKDPVALASAARGYALVMSQTLVLQDAVAHLRRTQILAETANAIGMAKIAQKEIEVGQAILEAARGAVNDAQAVVANAEKALA